LEFLAGYVVEKALSVDNIFVFVVLFQAFAVPKRMQHRVLFWGIIGALVMRGLFIAAGSALLTRFHWILYVFGLFLLATGIRLLMRRDAPTSDPRNNLVYRAFACLIPTTSQYLEDRFFVSANRKLLATRLFASLIAIEAVDLVFALDSIPAIFAITTDPFIVLTSNVFAIFGLRTMFFLLGGALERFRHLNIGLALVLIFVGAKLMISGVYQLPIALSLAVIVTLLAASILSSLWSQRERGAESV
jgi:tellurite resistance protein TerC